MKNLSQTADFLHAIVEQKPAACKTVFGQVIAEKVLEKLAERRYQMAKTLFKEQDEKESWCVVDVKAKTIKQTCKDEKTARDAHKRLGAQAGKYAVMPQSSALTLTGK